MPKWPGFSENFPLLSPLPIMIQLSGKSTKLAQKCQFVQKTTNRKSWKFSKVKFWPKPSIQNKAYIKPLNLELLRQLNSFVFSSRLEKCFEVTENAQKLKCKGDWAKLLPNICLLRQSWTKYLAKNVISNFAWFLTVIVKI